MNVSNLVILVVKFIVIQSMFKVSKQPLITTYNKNLDYKFNIELITVRLYLRLLL